MKGRATRGHREIAAAQGEAGEWVAQESRQGEQSAIKLT